MLNLKNTLDGYLKNVEVIGNTVQDTNNLANIRSVGDKVEGQELYKIGVISCGKNLLNTNTSTQDVLLDVDTGGTFNSAIYETSDYVAVHSGKVYQLKNPLGWYYNFYDSNKRFVKRIDFPFIAEQDGYVRVSYRKTDREVVQLEEGTQATPYETYQENKLEILSPVQLEKVGDVADRIICKDGVWGIEKNVCKVYGNQISAVSEYNQPLYNSFDLICYKLKPGFAKLNTTSNTPIICNLTLNMNLGDMNKNPQPACALYTDGNSDVRTLFLAVKVSELSEHSRDGVNEYLRNSGIYFLLPQSPQFIPLPHDQQVKLRTFAGQTNVFFNTEIAGQIKAQVPKSLGATVNTHTEQIKDLHNSLDRVKKLEETTVSTIETESSFTTVDATNNGYFEDVKLEGKTLVNLVGDAEAYKANAEIHKFVRKELTLGKILTVYGKSSKNIFIETRVNNTFARNITCKSIDGIINTVVTLNSDEIAFRIKGLSSQGWDAGVECTFFDDSFVILEGDYTNNPPEYFEGLLSVGQDVDNISSASTVNVADICTKGSTNFNIANIKGNTTYSMSIKRSLNRVYNLLIKDKVGGNTLHKIGNIGSDFITFTSPHDGVLFLNSYDVQEVYDIMLVPKVYTEDTMPSYTPYCLDKKPLLYYNPTTETWEKPVLREWDTIEKHSDGKYYYHKRSGEVVLDGSEDWDSIYIKEGYVWAYSSRVLPAYSKHYGNYIFNTCISDRLNTYYGYGHISDDYLGNSVALNERYLKISLSDSVLPSVDKEGIAKWLQANPVTVVYELAQEEVYECTNIDLMTYSGETNYIINSGAISPKSLLKVHNNISNVVKILQEKVSLLENTFIAGLKSVLSGDMYSLATILYPEDFEQNDNTEQDIMVIPE